MWKSGRYAKLSESIKVLILYVAPRSWACLKACAHNDLIPTVIVTLPCVFIMKWRRQSVTNSASNGSHFPHPSPLFWSVSTNQRWVLATKNLPQGFISALWGDTLPGHSVCIYPNSTLNNSEDVGRWTKPCLGTCQVSLAYWNGLQGRPFGTSGREVTWTWRGLCGEIYTGVAGWLIGSC